MDLVHSFSGDVSAWRGGRYPLVVFVDEYLDAAALGAPTIERRR